MAYPLCMMSTTENERRISLEIAAETLTDPRSVTRELAALRGADRHVRGGAGERIRQALLARGFNTSPEPRTP